MNEFEFICEKHGIVSPSSEVGSNRFNSWISQNHCSWIDQTSQYASADKSMRVDISYKFETSLWWHNLVGKFDNRNSQDFLALFNYYLEIQFDLIF